MRKSANLATMLAALSFAGLQPVAAQSGDEIGRIKNTTPGVSIERGGRTSAARSGAKLYENDTIVTSARARVGITFADDTRMAIGPNSEVTLDEYRYDRRSQTGNSRTTVRRGRVGIDSGNITRTGRDRMRVRTPTSTLGVRGTTFVVEVSE